MRALIHAAAAVLILSLQPGHAASPESQELRIDVPVTLKEAKVVFNLDHAAFDGDAPVGLVFLNIMTDRFAAEGTKSRIVAIFHGDAGYMALDDATYNRVRNWTEGNPYKADIARLMALGVEFEECGQTMREKGWLNADLIPGIKVNSGANFRLIELVNDGFVSIQP